MICIRPLSIKYRKSKWTMWFGSTLTSFQILLIMGMVPGNFGGFIDQIHNSAFNEFRKYFWMNPTHLWSESFVQESRIMPLGKFEVSNYYSSPLIENFIEVIFFALATLVGFVGCGHTDKDNANSHMRIGASISFMIPLTLSSVSCIIKCFFINNWDGFTIFSLLLSFVLMIYFTSEIINNLTGCSDSNLSEEDYFFRAFDLDELNLKEDRPSNFIQSSLNFIFPICLVILSNGYFIGAFIMFLLHSSMFFSF